MACQICGSENRAAYRISKHQILCNTCNSETPRKAGRDAFDRTYWGANFADVPLGTRREFYSDYLASNYTLDEYIRATSFDA